MKKLTTLIAASAVVAASVAPAVAQNAPATNDPFVSTQAQGSLLSIGGVTYVVVGVVAAGLIVALADGSSTTTSLVRN
ncbi:MULTISPECIES: hypothetical protein [unclassified Roseovarius]|uniref:hypothetical protein n=1 Tax=unclassified Roseovarius TaxID=2614913 RepID=UPI00273E5BE2|nr:hypothetical protein [Roseovarius sp. MMSF_3350]